MIPIAFDHVSKFYGSEVALEEIHLAFEENQTSAVVGTSGSGKSTLIQLINGLVKPDKGTVLVFGEPIDYQHLPELRLLMGYAVQRTGLFPHLTVEQNIALLARLNHWEPGRTKARAEELMRLVNLPLGLRARYPHELSGGQKQRVGLCRAMMLNPKIFLLDEAFGALDPITRNEIHEEFLRLQESEARTIVLVTHDLREALKLAKRIVILHRGRLMQYGTSEDILKHPANEFVEHFMDAQLKS